MAAMAQQDCGQCGYNCADYANALFLKTEERLNLCQPGGKDTLRMLKKLAAETGSAPGGNRAILHDSRNRRRGGGGPGFARPTPANTRSRRPSCRGVASTTRPSEKETWHIEIDLTDTGIDYVVGDSLGLFPTNAAALVDAVIAELGARRPSGSVGETGPCATGLLNEYALGAAPDGLFQLLSYLSGGEQRRKGAGASPPGEDPDGDAAHLDVLGALHKFPGAPAERRGVPRGARAAAAAALLDLLLPQGRSRPGLAHRRRGALLAALAAAARRRLDLSGRAHRRDPARFTSTCRRPTASASRPTRPPPVIMVGPGTGVAPFRAFLRERAATAASGRNWLFYGHQRQASDFFYREEFNGLKDGGVLTRLSLALVPGDGTEKTYVQDRMARSRRGAVAAGSRRARISTSAATPSAMAKDVERAIVDIAGQHGGRSADEAVAYVAAPEEVRALPGRRVLMNLHVPDLAPPAVKSTCPYCGGRLRGDPAAGRAGAGRASRAIRTIRRTAGGSAPRVPRSARPYPSTAGFCTRACVASAHPGTRPSTRWRRACAARRPSTGPRRSRSTSPVSCSRKTITSRTSSRRASSARRTSTPIRACACPPPSRRTSARFGSDTVPGCYEDLDEADLIVLVGSNAAWCHPVLFRRMLEARTRRGTRIVTVDPRRTQTGEEADLFLGLAPGTDSALFSGLLVHLAEAGALDRAYCRRAHGGLRRGPGAGARDRPRASPRRRWRPDSTPADVARFFEMFPHDAARGHGVLARG